MKDFAGDRHVDQDLDQNKFAGYACYVLVMLMPRFSFSDVLHPEVDLFCKVHQSCVVKDKTVEIFPRLYFWKTCKIFVAHAVRLGVLTGNAVHLAGQAFVTPGVTSSGFRFLGVSG